MSNTDKTSLFLDGYKKNVQFWLIGVFIVAGGYTVVNFMDPHKRTFAIFFCILAIFLVHRFFVKTVFGGADVVNMVVESIDIDNNQVVITTLGFSELFNTVKRDPLSYTFARSKVNLMPATGKLPFTKFDKQRAGDFYVLTAEGETFLIGEKLFVEFERIRQDLNG